jgi:RNA polymerase sigma factor (sigma-70 family)
LGRTAVASGAFVGRVLRRGPAKKLSARGVIVVAGRWHRTVVSRFTDAEVYEKHADELVRLATGLVGPADAADVVSSAVARLLGSAAWRQARDQRAYLFRSVVNEARMHHRAGRRRRARELRAAVTERREDLQDVEVLDYLSSLSVRQRAVVVLTYWHDLDQETIAEVLGVSRGTVARHLDRAHVRLREVIGDERYA